MRTEIHLTGEDISVVHFEGRFLCMGGLNGYFLIVQETCCWQRLKEHRNLTTGNSSVRQNRHGRREVICFLFPLNSLFF